MSPRSQGLLAINLAAVIFGSAALFGKLPIAPLWIVAGRAAFAALVLACLALVRRKLALPRPRHLPLLLTTAALLALHWVSFFMSVQQAGVAVATLTFATFPLFTVVIEAVLAHRPPRVQELLAGAVIIVGVSLLVDGAALGDEQVVGTAAGFISGMTFACFGLASKSLTSKLSPLLTSLYQNIAVALLVGVCLPFSDRPPHTPEDWLGLALLGAITTALMHQLYLYALQRLPASTCSGFVALEPVYAIVFAALLFGEPITLWVGLSACCIVGASLLLLLRDRRAPVA